MKFLLANLCGLSESQRKVVNVTGQKNKKTKQNESIPCATHALSVMMISWP